MAKAIPPDLNIKREAIIFKGFATIVDIATFRNCSYSKARDYYDDIIRQAKGEGKKTIDKKVSIKRLLDYCELTEDRIFEFAEIERARQKVIIVEEENTNL